MNENYNPLTIRKIVEITKETPNDTELGNAIRKIVNDYLVCIEKPPFTEDYTQ